MPVLPCRASASYRLSVIHWSTPGVPLEYPRLAIGVPLASRLARVSPIRLRRLSSTPAGTACRGCGCLQLYGQRPSPRAAQLGRKLTAAPTIFMRSRPTPQTHPPSPHRRCYLSLSALAHIIAPPTRASICAPCACTAPPWGRASAFISTVIRIISTLIRIHQYRYCIARPGRSADRPGTGRSVHAALPRPRPSARARAAPVQSGSVCRGSARVPPARPPAMRGVRRHCRCSRASCTSTRTNRASEPPLPPARPPARPPACPPASFAALLRCGAVERGLQHWGSARPLPARLFRLAGFPVCAGFDSLSLAFVCLFVCE
jgi:hypothetical protein